MKSQLLFLLLLALAACLQPSHVFCRTGSFIFEKSKERDQGFSQIDKCLRNNYKHIADAELLGVRTSTETKIRQFDIRYQTKSGDVVMIKVAYVAANPMDLTVSINTLVGGYRILTNYMEDGDFAKVDQFIRSRYSQLVSTQVLNVEIQVVLVGFNYRVTYKTVQSIFYQAVVWVVPWENKFEIMSFNQFGLVIIQKPTNTITSQAMSPKTFGSAVYTASPYPSYTIVSPVSTLDKEFRQPVVDPYGSHGVPSTSIIRPPMPPAPDIKPRDYSKLDANSAGKP